MSAITSTQQRLKLYSKVPPNGLVVYCGEIITAEGKERKINIDFEPFKPINTSLYLCDNKFHTEALAELLESDQKFGFIIMDGNGRWASRRSLPRVAGHRAGAEAVRRTMQAAVDSGVEVLTLYAFSSENWRRSEDEVSDLKGLMRFYLERELGTIDQL